MTFVKLFLGLLVGAILIYIIWLICDKISWYRAKYEEAKHGAVIIAEHTRMLRELVQNSQIQNRKDLDDIFQSILFENANMAWVLGGIKLVYEVSRVKPTPTHEPVNKSNKK